MTRPTDRSLFYAALQAGREWQSALADRTAAVDHENELRAEFGDPDELRSELAAVTAEYEVRQALAEKVGGHPEHELQRDALAGQVAELKARAEKASSLVPGAAASAKRAAKALEKAGKAFDSALDEWLRRERVNHDERIELARLIAGLDTPYGREVKAAMRTARHPGQLSVGEDPAPVQADLTAAVRGIYPMAKVPRPHGGVSRGR